MSTRQEQFQALFTNEPNFRLRQIESALFDRRIENFAGMSALPSTLRTALEEKIPWISATLFRLFVSRELDTHKAILRTLDNKLFETVLMQNRRGGWTICVSSQIGCAMRCTFCATGTMGLTRSLTSDEIADQYRFWNYFLKAHPDLPQRISNVVFMGMGEPLANYENVKKAIQTWLAHTDLGKTRITVSSVGILSQLEKLLTDPDWPDVRIAISLHSANQKRREDIVPTTIPDFLQKLAAWSHEYARLHGNRRHYITYEYTLLSEINDTPELAAELARYILTTGARKINVIPYNPVPGKPFVRSVQARIDRFKKILLQAGIDVTQRRTMGEDIAAACGQLVVSQTKN